MRATVFHGPKDMRVERVPDPTIEEPTDCIVRVTTTAICGSDLHFYNGFIPQPRPLVMGHEFMGVIEAVGPEVKSRRVGERVVVPFPIACGTCWFCNHALTPHCENSNPKNYGPDGGVLKEKGAGLFGYGDVYGGYAGGQAEFVRVPFADVGPRAVPDPLDDDDVIFLTDILSTGYAAVDFAGVKPGDAVLVAGAGPVGLMAMKCAWLRGASRVFAVDREAYRLAKAEAVANAEPVLLDDGALEVLRQRTGGRGPDVAIDAVGMEAHRTLFDKAKNLLHAQAGSIAGFEFCLRAVRRGGAIGIVGVYAVPYDNFPFGQIFEKGVTLRAGQAPVHAYIDMLLEHIAKGRLVARDVMSHKLSLDQAAEGYAMFNDKRDNCVKVVLKP